SDYIGALVDIVAKRLGEVRALDVEFGLGALDSLGGFKSLAKPLDFRFGAPSFFAQARVMLKSTARLQYAHDLAPAPVKFDDALITLGDPGFGGRDLALQVRTPIFNDRSM